MYKVQVSKRIKKDLLNINLESYKRIIKTLKSLEENPNPSNSLKLSGRDGYRIRVGNYRIIYEINSTEKSVIILSIGHRKEVYK